mgnify:CR=1 FL=1
MDSIGCTTPYGLELENICTEENKMVEADYLFMDVLLGIDKNVAKECPNACQFLMNRITTTDYKDKNDTDNAIWLVFDEYIKVTTSTYGYTELELLAELGGYVGLFLGLSVFDLRLVFNKIFNIFMPN